MYTYVYALCRGNPDNLCGEDGPGQCYVPCDADCSDIQPAASSARLPVLSFIHLFPKFNNYQIQSSYIIWDTIYLAIKAKVTLFNVHGYIQVLF